MTPRVEKKVTAKLRKPAFALIWWMNTPYKDIISVKLFGKKMPAVDDVITLPWKDKVDGKTAKYEAKVLAFGGTYEELDRLIVNENGKIHDPSQQIFSAAAINEKRELRERQKMVEAITQSNKRKFDEELKQDGGLFDRGHYDYGQQQKRNRVLSPVTSNADCQSSLRQSQSNHVPMQWSNAAMQSGDARPLTFTQNHLINPKNHPSLFKNKEEVKKSQYISWETQHQVRKEEQIYNMSQAARSGIASTSTSRDDNNEEWSPSSHPGIQQHSPQNSQYFTDNATLPQPFAPNHQAPTSDIPQSAYGRQDIAGYQHSIESTSSGVLTSGPPDTFLIHRESLETSASNQLKEIQKRPKGESRIIVSHQYDVDDDSSNSSSKSDQENNVADPWNEKNIQIAGRAMAGMIPVTVTKENLYFQKVLLAAMEWNYKNDPNNRSMGDDFQVPDSYFQGDISRVEIWPGSKFYIPWSAKDAIVRKIQDVDKKNRWKILVRENIRLVYGKHIGQFSARGSKINSRPPMNILLFKGLQDWAQSVSDTPIKEKEFIGYINKLASNARRDPNEIKEKKCKQGNETKKTDDSNDEQSAEAVDIRPESSPAAVLMHHAPNCHRTPTGLTYAVL